MRTTMSQAALGPAEEAPTAAPASAASRFAGLTPTVRRRKAVESGRGQEGGKHHRALDSREADASTAPADGADTSEAGGSVADADADAPLWRTLAVHGACEARIDGKWCAVAVVGVTHKGYEIARYRVRATGAATGATSGGLIDVHEVSSAEVRRFYDASAAASRAPPDTPACTFFARDGYCKRGAKCTFAHVGIAADRPSAAEVEAAIAAAASDRAAAAATSAGDPSARFFPESVEVRAARDADAFLQGLQGPSGAVGGGGVDDDKEEQQLAQQRLEEEMAGRARRARSAPGGTYSLQSLHPV